MNRLAPKPSSDAARPAAWLPVFSIASALLILDRVTKYLITSVLFEGQSIPVIPDIFHLTLVLNKGIAFGLFKGRQYFFILLSGLAILSIAAYLWRRRRVGARLSLALGLILGGALGNVIDRVRLGHVIDFLDFRVWPVFNVADSAITIGAVLLAWNVLRHPPLKLRRMPAYGSMAGKD